MRNSILFYLTIISSIILKFSFTFISKSKEQMVTKNKHCSPLSNFNGKNGKIIFPPIFNYLRSEKGISSATAVIINNIMTGKLFLYKRARVKESLGYDSFLVELLENGKEILATISRSRFRVSGGGRRIRLLKGNIVDLEIPFGDLKKGRIIRFVAKK